MKSQNGATMKVSLLDLGKAFVQGNIDTKDINDLAKIAVDKGKKSLKSLQAGKLVMEQEVPRRSSLRSSQNLPGARRNSLLGSVIGPDGNLASLDEILGKEDAWNLKDLPEGRRDRKRNSVNEMPSPGDVLDLVVEEVATTALEQPWYLAPCLSPEVASRHKQDHHDKPDDKHHGHHHHHSHSHGDEGGESDGEGVNFGLADFHDSGFAIEEADEVQWPDMIVPNRLQLVQAIHKQTSIRRFCLLTDKTELPAGIGPREVRNLIKQLQKCDHANILYLHETFEDHANLYFMYEHFPCVTLQSTFKSHSWSQEGMVQIIRECLAATAYAASHNLLHLSWTLSHVLIPVSAVKAPLLCKVFGFGLMGVLMNDTADHLCWAPECIEKYHQVGVAEFLHKIDHALRPLCDSWSLGTIAYSLVSRQLPAQSDKQAQTRKWQFTLAIDDVDHEARSLIEGLMDPLSERRSTIVKAQHHEWIRRRWRPPLGAPRVFAKLEEFCRAPLAKRLFGRFLTRFLDAGHVMEIAQSFYCLDLGGSGNLSCKELQVVARQGGYPQRAAEMIFETLAPHGSHEITLRRFTETLAEEVIDGAALRHAFESLDDDGSEQVSAKELYDELVELDGSITMEDVLEHIESAELGVEEEDAVQDHAIDYKEFVQLFPVRVARMNQIKERHHRSCEASETLSTLFIRSNPFIQKWMHTLEEAVLTIHDLGNKAVDNRNVHADEAARGLKRQFAKVEEGLKHPPGPLDAQEMMARYKSQRAKNSITTLGYDSFLQDQALKHSFNTVIMVEMKALKAALREARRVDSWKAYDAAAFVNIFDSPEALMADVALSGRGLPFRIDDKEDKEGDSQEETTSGSLLEVLEGCVSSLRALLT
eukprot:TRINITY_DN23743_c0_g1_i1.p1 TRINITY_DN23743_c0_g1~~TRINITY_DN23743_c0_g1_i1.p1  ORF type:complete len:873 (-),score=222.78 TRINITY_DN23743_c0_g1_i1:62-2680(-)